MRDFFHGWRRKVGCVTLVMACALMGGLLRSYRVNDSILASTSKYTGESLSSAVGRIYWFSEIDATKNMDGHRAFLEWESSTIDPKDERLQPHCGDYRRYPFGFAINHLEGPSGSMTSRMISYWYFVIPLTLLSAYLILWKPRKRG